MTRIGFVVLLGVVLGFSPLAHAALIDNGGGLIYDTDLNITWYDNPIATDWSTAREWAAGLNVGGITGWRLPTTPGTTQGYTVEGELGHLYAELGGVPPNPVVCSNFAPFTTCWGAAFTGTDYAPAPTTGVWIYYFSEGFQGVYSKGCWGACYAAVIAVHDGNISPSAGFTQSDLAGTWYFQVTGDYTSVNAPIWVSGTMTVNATGAITGGTTVNNLGQQEAVTGGTLTIDSAGQVSGTLIHSNFTESLPHGKLDASKTTLDMVMSNTDGRALFVGIKGEGTFAQADLAGTWYFQVYGDSPSANRPYWASGTMIVNAAGNVTGGTAVNDSGVVKTLTGGSLTIDSLGQVTGTVALSDGTTESLPYGKLDASKTSLTMVNSDPVYRALFVAFSAGASSLINGQCGSADGGTFPSAPSSNLCSAGTPSSVGGTGPWTWNCSGSNGGTTASCSANVQQTQTWTVTPSAGSNGSISPSTPQTVNNAATKSFTVTPAVGYSASVGGTCGGSPSSGTAQFTYTTNAITANCTVTVTFTANGSCTAVPPGAILVSPSGTIATTTPTFTWNAVPCASWYYLWVDDSTGNKIKQWYTAAQAGCGTGTGTCSVTPTTALANGSGTWWIQTWDDAGYGPWSSGMNVNVNANSCSAPPGAATLLSPSEAITTATPTYTWIAVPCSSWYYLWVDDSTGNKIKQWYTAAQAGCGTGTGTCSVTPTTALANGSGTWWIQTWDDAGYGPWSSGMNVNVNANSCSAPPGAATLLSPSGAITTATPTYTWIAVPCSSWYYLWVNDSTSPTGKVKLWYTAAQAGCPSGTGTCSVTPSVALATGSGEWWIQTWDDAGYGPWSNGTGFSVN